MTGIDLQDQPSAPSGEQVAELMEDTRHATVRQEWREASIRKQERNDKLRLVAVIVAGVLGIVLVISIAVVLALALAGDKGEAQPAGVRAAFTSSQRGPASFTARLSTVVVTSTRQRPSSITTRQGVLSSGQPSRQYHGSLAAHAKRNSLAWNASHEE